jgi:hypothetical protein
VTLRARRVTLVSRQVLYACENDHSAVEELAALLHSRVEVVPCMVDRICSDRSIKRSAITVVTEPYEGSIIPLTPSERLCAVDEDCREPLGGKSVFYPRTQAMADYRYQRKIFFVNHMHTTLALMTLCRHRSATNATAEEMLDYDGACVPLPLLNPDDVSFNRVLYIQYEVQSGCNTVRVLSISMRVSTGERPAEAGAARVGHRADPSADATVRPRGDDGGSGRL